MQGSEVPDRAAESDESRASSSAASEPDDATNNSGNLSKEPPWLRRAVLLVLVAVAGYQVAVWAFTGLRSFLALLFLAWLFATSIEPPVRALTQRGIRRGAATGLVMLGVALFAIGFLAAFGALLVDQLAQLVSSLPNLVSNMIDWFNRTLHIRLPAGDVIGLLQLTPDRIQQIVQSLAPGVAGIVTSVAEPIVLALTFPLFAYFISAQAPALRDTISRPFPPRQQRIISTVWAVTVEKTGGYVFSRLVLATLSSLVTGLILLLLGVPYWLPLAIWTGLVSQFIPTIGTYLAIGVPALVALANDPWDALWVVILYTAYQQVENYVIGPRITARTVQIHPAVAVGAVIAGATLFGAIGALVAIPVAAAVQSLIETYGRRYELVSADAPPETPDTAPVAHRRRWRWPARSRR